MGKANVNAKFNVNKRYFKFFFLFFFFMSLLISYWLIHVSVYWGKTKTS